MNDIIKIEIRLERLNEQKELIIIPNILKYYVKGEERNIKKEDIIRLLNIICLWKYEYPNNIIDNEKYEIKIHTSKGIDIYKGTDNNQIGYNEFIKLIGELYE